MAPGDTLYGIAWKYRLDPRTLARWNRIPPPYIIYPGQRLRLTPPKSTPARPLPSKTPKTRKAPPPPPRKAVAKKGIPWTWPAFGRVISTFSPRDPNRKGIDIAGRKGQLVYAAAPGKVVYSGSGLVGYGKLIIIKHNENYLSAYAHNERLLVKEGDQVRAGQPIAVMGKTGTDRVKLHFEIRYRGKPVDPLKFLPKNRHSPKEVADGTKAKGDVF
ncbi:MAG: LysM peptidoglycan-binding domain-containing protein [Gammaproteobacteria bacterium]|nr:MAG: LysM peptidoglycan-binding domain-containing protein [Gammaproteobacteria bacterium]